MKTARCRARGRLLAFGLFLEAGERFCLPLAQAVSLGTSIEIEGVDDAEEVAPERPMVSARGRGMEGGPTFDRQMHRATRSRTS